MAALLRALGAAGGAISSRHSKSVLEFPPKKKGGRPARGAALRQERERCRAQKRWLPPNLNDGRDHRLALGFENSIEAAQLFALSGSGRALWGSISKRILYLGSPTQ